MPDQLPPVISPPVPASLRRGHLGERLDRYLAFGYPVAACLAMAVPVIIFLNDKRGIGPWEVVGILVGAVLLGLAVGWLILVFAAATGRGLTQVMTGSGNLAPSPSFSLQESLVIRGRPDEAAQGYRDHLVLHPADLDARLALADLLATHLNDVGVAERLYLEVRGSDPTPIQERTATESLMALYRKTGNAGREMAELARFADRYQGTEAARSARLALSAMKRARSDDQLPG